MIRLYYAVVVDDNSTHKRNSPKDSYIKVRLIPEMKDIDDTLLPWVRPFSASSPMGMTADNFTHSPPVIGSTVWVIFMDEPYLKEGYYIAGRYLDGFFDYTGKWNDSAIPEKSASTYPNPRFWLLPDNSIFFIDYNTGDKGLLNSNGSYTFIKGDGKIYVNTKDQPIRIYNNNGFMELGSNGTLNVNNNLTVDI